MGVVLCAFSRPHHFEAKLQYADNGRLNLGYFRYTGKWWEVAKLLSLEECLSWIEGGNIFMP